MRLARCINNLPLACHANRKDVENRRAPGEKKIRPHCNTGRSARGNAVILRLLPLQTCSCIL